MENNRGNTWLIGVALFVIIALVANQAEGLLTLLILGGLLFMVRQFEGRGNRAFRERRRTTPRPIPSTDRQPHTERVYEHALNAVAAAGCWQVKPSTTQIADGAFGGSAPVDAVDQRAAF